MRDSEASGKKPVEAVEQLHAQRGKLERVSRHITKDKKTGAVLTGTEVGVEQTRRKTGIDIVGDVAWGTHFCIFYQSKQDLIDLLVPYFKAGLENNELCMWITSEPLNAKEAKKSLKRAVKNLDSYIRKGQIEILDYSQWYTALGKFDADMVLQGWADKEQEARRMGFDGLRLTGNTFWLEKKDWKEFSDYEAAVNDIIGKYKMLAICTYFLDKCNAAEIIDVVSNHQFALIKSEGEWIIIESSERKKALEELQRSEIKFKTLVEHIPNKVFIKDRNSVYIFCNKNYADDLHIEPEKIVGKTDYDFYYKELAEKYSADDKRIIETGKTEDIEEKYIEKGEERWVHTVKIPYKNNKGKTIGLLGIFRDITERKKTEAEARDTQQKLIEQQRHEKEHVEAELAKLRDDLVKTTRLAAIGQVSASIAHDLRNPLGSVRNASYFLRRRLSKDKPKASEHLKIIDQEVARADQIITNLLEMAQPKLSHKQEVDLAEIVEQVFGQAKGIEGVRCRISLVPDPFMVQTDPNQLRQAISNIISNAVYAMKGHGEFLVEATRDSDYDTLVFRDTGPGFDPEVRDRLFEPLITTKASGTGLGLTICRQIVEKHDGTIHAEDCKGGGAVIRIRLPRQ